MPFEIVRNDISLMQVDAIVNTANPKPVVGMGADYMIHQKAGPRLLEARQRIGDIAVGDAAFTAAFELSARYVIHTVGPVWCGGTQKEEALLRKCYVSCLHLALELGCQSVAFPLISSGNYGFPKDRALKVAISAFSDFLLQQEMQIYLVVFDSGAYRLSEQLFRDVANYIDENYAGLWETRQKAQRRAVYSCSVEAAAPVQETALDASLSAAHGTLEELLRKQDAGFTETLLRLIDRSGKKDAHIYKKANLSKQHFSKIRNNPDYRPTKATALALALALELDLAETTDLIGRAGYALSNSSKFDLIVRYFILQKNYNIIEINIALYEFDQPLLGG